MNLTLGHRLASLTGALLLAGCAATVVLEPAEDSNNAGCAEVSVRLPERISGPTELERRYTNAQATSAWGDPVRVIWRCGIPPVTISKLPCVTVADIDWLVDESAAPKFRFISFGRSPASEVIVDSENASGVTTLETLASAIAVVPAELRCTTAD